jgi:hypothetical protein
MYYFKDHLNFSNNLQDNLYILRQRQLKEAAAWSPSSGGPAIPESAAGTNELKDRMRNVKQSGDRPQSKDYLEMEAEVKRREGTGSSGIPQSSDVKTDRVAGDWVERYARKLDMDPRKVENIRRGVIDMDTSGRGEDPISQTQDQVAQRGVEAYDKAKQYVVDMQKRDADKRKPVQPISGGSDIDIQRGQYNTNDQNSDTMDFRQEVKNFTNNFKSPAEFKTGSVNDTGADAGGYGPPKSEDDTGKTAAEKLEILKNKDPNYDAFKQKVLVNIQVDKQFPNRQYNSDRKYYTYGQPPAKEELYSKKPDYVNTNSQVNTGISDAQRALTDKASGAVKDIIRGGSDWMKKQSMNSPGVRYPEVGPDSDVQRGQYNTNDDTSDTMDFRQEVKNFSNLFKSPAEFKTGSMNDAGADAGGYGPPSDLNVDSSVNLNTRDPMAFAKYLNSLRQPRFSNIPKSNVGGGGPDIDTQRGQFNINDPDSPGYNPNADMVSPRKPSTEYGTDLVDRLKQVGSDTTPDQSSLKTTLQDIIDRMKNNTLPKQPFRPRVSRRPRSR